MSKQRKDARNRNWTFIEYDDSAPKNWREILSDELHLVWAESPLHDCDLNDDGTHKKNHRHILVCFEGNKSADQIQAISDRISGVLVQPVDSVKGLIQYFIHKNNPEKYQYNKEDIICHGLSIDDYFGLTPSQMQAMARDMVQFIEDNEIVEFDDFNRICLSNTVPADWLYILMNRNTSYFRTLLYNRSMIAKDKAKENRANDGR